MLKNTNWKELAFLLSLTAAVVFLWDTPVVYPLKILVVFFHELSHGLAAVATGGSIERIQLESNGAGLCVTAGGSRFIVISAGYLGSLLWGGAILKIAARIRSARVPAFALGILVLLVGVLLVRPIISFGFVFCLFTGGALVFSGIKFRDGVNTFLLKFVGLTSCMYALADIKSDILDNPTLHSDAYSLAQYTGLPTLFWGALWLMIAIPTALLFLVHACAKNPAGQTGRLPKGL